MDDLPAVVQIIRTWQAAGQTVVFTNGCFDLLHVGHLRLLQAAKREGDRLVVAVNSDRSVTRLKGASRPVVPFSQRIELLRALRPVDAAIGFDDDTPEQLIKAVCPDVLVKGAEYSIDQIVGSDTVREAGGRVTRIELMPGVSTSDILAKIVASYQSESSMEERRGKR